MAASGSEWECSRVRRAGAAGRESVVAGLRLRAFRAARSVVRAPHMYLAWAQRQSGMLAFFGAFGARCLARAMYPAWAEKGAECPPLLLHLVRALWRAPCTCICPELKNRAEC